jgi:hypothetical protein
MLRESALKMFLSAVVRGGVEKEAHGPDGTDTTFLSWVF